MMIFESIHINALGQILGPFIPSSRIFLLYIISAIILAFVAYHQINHEHDEDGNDIKPERKGFLSYLFDKEVLFHASTLQDLKYFIVNAFVYTGFAAQFLIGTHGFSVVFNNALNKTLGTLSSPLITGELSLVIYTIVSVIAIDIGIYLSHRAQHSIPFLWEFHKVHHSAEKLTPLTLYRMHPVDLFITAFIVSFLGGLAFAGLFYLTGETPQALTLFGLNVITLGFYLIGYNLRHSHIWFNYPVWLSKIFISPAQHQIHHSSDPKHFDRNFGLIFSFWDRFGKSHYIPHRYEKLSFGISKKEPNPFKSISELYYSPFFRSWKIISNSMQSPIRQLIAALAIIAVSLSYINFNSYVNRQVALTEIASVHLEKMTWTGIQKAIADGFDTIIIPTGGVEQNGPHVILGKHRVVVRHTSEQIAKKLGNTFVAPVIDHVPEGDIEPTKTIHMRYAGTVSVPEIVFEHILEASARSMKAHGFKNIFFIGDSHGNQNPQKNVAKKLNALWHGDGILVGHINEYYDSNNQFSYLESVGYSEAEIGYHAGIRDTSELLFIDPSAVHYNYIEQPKGMQSGASGNPGKASANIGKKMVELKVDAALKQIDKLLNNKPLTLPNDEHASIANKK